MTKSITVEVRDAQGTYHAIEFNTLIDAAREAAREAFARESGTLENRSAVKRYLQAMIGSLKHECFVCLMLDTRHRVIAVRELFNGTIDAASVYPREVVRACLIDNAAAVIFAHNHPSGATYPSEGDIAITHKLTESLRAIDVKVLDHFVVGEDVTAFTDLHLIG